MLVDVHCHLDHHLYKDVLDDVIKRAKEAGIKKLVTSGIDMHTNKIAIELSEKYDIVEASLGRYPEDALDREGYYEHTPEAKPSTLEEDEEFFTKNKDKFVSIGEIGLDLYHGKDIELQKTSFRFMIELSIKLDKPIVIHTRKAEKETLDVLDEYLVNSELNNQKKLEDPKFKLKKSKTLDPRKVILHCFSGKKKLIDRAISNKFNFSIPANIAKNFQFQHIAKNAPMKQILTETDGPYLSPYKNEDGSFNLNESSYVKETIKVIAEIKKITEEECEKQIFMNYQMTF